MYSENTAEFSIQLAVSEEDLEAAYRVRYDVYYLEKQRGEWADIENHLWQDPLDKRDAQIIITKMQDRVVGTMRFVPRTTGPFLKEESYQLSLLASIIGMEKERLLSVIGLIDRGAILPEARGCGINRRMLIFGEYIAKQAGCEFVIGTPADPKMMSSVLHLGWVQYGEGRHRWGDASECCYKRLLATE